MVKINYILWAKRFYRGNFNLFPGYHEYLKSIKDIKSESPAATRKELLNEELVPDLRAVVVEAYLAREKILEIYERAKELDRELILVENLSYGEISLAPVTEERAGVKYITGTDIKVISTKIASSWEQEMLTDILPGGEMRKIGEKQPLVVLVDGTINVTVRTEGEGCVHIPSSFAKEYVKFFMAVNKGLTGNVDPGDFYALESTVKAIEKNEEFKRVASFFSYFSGGKKPYKTFYWYPGDMVLANRSYSDIEKLGDTADITGPAVVMMQTVNDPGSLSKQAREYINSEYVPGGLDDKSYFKKSKFFYDGKNLPRLVNSMTEISRRMFRRFCKAYNKKIEKAAGIKKE
jgi:hypothetical protein